MEKENKDLSCCDTRREDCPYCGKCPKCGRGGDRYYPPYHPYEPNQYPYYWRYWDGNAWTFLTNDDTGNVTVRFNGA